MTRKLKIDRTLADVKADVAFHDRVIVQAKYSKKRLRCEMNWIINAGYAGNKLFRKPK